MIYTGRCCDGVFVLTEASSHQPAPSSHQPAHSSYRPLPSSHRPLLSSHRGHPVPTLVWSRVCTYVKPVRSRGIPARPRPNHGYRVSPARRGFRLPGLLHLTSPLLHLTSPLIRLTDHFLRLTGLFCRLTGDTRCPRWGGRGVCAYVKPVRNRGDPGLCPTTGTGCPRHDGVFVLPEASSHRPAPSSHRPAPSSHQPAHSSYRPLPWSHRPFLSSHRPLLSSHRGNPVPMVVWSRGCAYMKPVRNRGDPGLCPTMGTGCPRHDEIGAPASSVVLPEASSHRPAPSSHQPAHSSYRPLPSSHRPLLSSHRGHPVPTVVWSRGVRLREAGP